MKVQLQKRRSIGWPGIASGVIGVLLLGVFIAGFFGPRGGPGTAACNFEESGAFPYRMESRAVLPEAKALDRTGPAAPYAKMIESSLKAYYREARLRLAVSDTLKANDEIERIAEKHKCEIVNLVIEGNDRSRSCSVEFSVPADRFDGFVRELRGLGEVIQERITARRLQGTGAGGGTDSRLEFARVRVELVDRGGRRGIFARSLDASINHFIRGGALLLEGTGYVLPFLIPLSVLVGLLLLAHKRPGGERIHLARRRGTAGESIRRQPEP